MESLGPLPGSQIKNGAPEAIPTVLSTVFGLIPLINKGKNLYSQQRGVYFLTNATYQLSERSILSAESGTIFGLMPHQLIANCTLSEEWYAICPNAPYQLSEQSTLSEESGTISALMPLIN